MILKYLKIIAEAWKGILAIGGIIIVIATTAVAIDHWKVKNIDTDKSLKEVKQKVDTVLVYLQEMKEESVVVKGDILELKTGQRNIVNGLAIHLAKDKSVTKDDLLEFMRQFQNEVKKNEMLNYIGPLKNEPIQYTQK
jgi:hypothetical protein